MEPLDQLIRERLGPEPVFDAVMSDFLANSGAEFRERCARGGLVDHADLGTTLPWLWRLTFRTRGLVRDAAGNLGETERHTVAVRFLPDYLRHVNQFQTLFLIEPKEAFHPNLSPPGICLHLYPGMPLVEIAESLHRLFSWSLRQLNEPDALNRDACAWGRANLERLPLDDRPLFGRAVRFTLEPAEDAR
jgi:hypothetical protein